MEIKHPYLLFLGDARDNLAAKTAFGVVDWRRDWCVGQMRLPGCGADIGLPDMTIEEAVEAGAKTFVVGAVNPGGVLPEAWVATIVQALAAGMDVASGLHTRLNSIEAVGRAATDFDRELFDVRHSDRKFPVGSGKKRSGRRLLTVGTDCSIGKKYTALAMEQAMKERGFNAEFRATGQTGILIAGRGIAIDAVGADFISGAVEWLTPDAPDNHWDVVEGQGSLFHPSFAGVSLGLLHGSQADYFIICHEPTRTTMRNVSNPLPTIDEVVEATVRFGSLTNPDIAPLGIAVNTAALSEEDALEYLLKLTNEHGLPASDPVRFGLGDMADALAERLAK